MCKLSHPDAKLWQTRRIIEFFLSSMIYTQSNQLKYVETWCRCCMSLRDLYCHDWSLGLPIFGREVGFVSRLRLNAVWEATLRAREANEPFSQRKNAGCQNMLPSSTFPNQFGLWWKVFVASADQALTERQICARHGPTLYRCIYTVCSGVIYASPLMSPSFFTCCFALLRATWIFLYVIHWVDICSVVHELQLY